MEVGHYFMPCTTVVMQGTTLNMFFSTQTIFTSVQLKIREQSSLGTGCPRGFFSAMDAMWLMKQMDSGKMSILECLAERESINRYSQMLRKVSQLKGL